MKNCTLKVFLQITFLFIFSAIHSQALFNKRYSPSSSEAGCAITVTHDEGFAVVGVSIANGAGGDIFIMKLNQEGAIQWQKDIFGTNLERVSGIHQLSNGNFIIGGSTYSYGSGCSDAFEVMLDSSGTLLWSKAYGDINCNEMVGFSIAHGNGFIGCGFPEGSADNGWLIKTGQNGELEWSKRYEGTQGFLSVKPSKDGGYLAVGANSIISVLKTDSIGIPIWFKRYLTSTGNTHCYDVVTLDDGSAVLTGQIYLNAFGGIADVYLMKIDSTGNLIWFKTFGFTFEEYGFSIKETYDGGFIVSGWTNSFGHGAADALLLKADRNGDLEWAKTYGNAWQDKASQIQTTSDSGYVLVGQSYTALNYDSSYIYVVRTDQFGKSCDYLDWTPLQQTQNYTPTSKTISAIDFGVDSTCSPMISSYLSREDNICSVTAISTLGEASIRIFPNPVTSILSIEGLPENSVIYLFSISGELILSQKVTESVNMDVSSLHQGVYILQWACGVKKIIKM
jgi:hypothetical protein